MACILRSGSRARCAFGDHIFLVSWMAQIRNGHPSPRTSFHDPKWAIDRDRSDGTHPPKQGAPREDRKPHVRHPAHHGHRRPFSRRAYRRRRLGRHPGARARDLSFAIDEDRYAFGGGIRIGYCAAISGGSTVASIASAGHRREPARAIRSRGSATTPRSASVCLFSRLTPARKPSRSSGSASFLICS